MVLIQYSTITWVFRELIDDLNLSEEIIYPDEQGVKNRYVLLNGKPAKIPLTFYDFFNFIIKFFQKLGFT